ncbi:helix-turn-helix domain-containing protein [Gymnodinialimonas sp.]
MTGEQIRAARALLGWTASDLAQAAGVSYPTVQRMDATQGPVGGRHATVIAIREALERDGIQFLQGGETANGQGVAIASGKE